MNVNRVNPSNIQQILDQMRAISNKAQPEPAAEKLPEDSVKVEFSSVLKSAIDKVSDLQSQSEQLKESFVAGDPEVSLVDVSLASQKSSLAFEASVQVRNRVINAYKEIMNMPI